MPLQDHLRGDKGATLVEFALILPVLMALILGMFTGGLAYNRKISMTNAVREGARFGATLPSSATLASEVAQRVQDLSGGELRAGQVCVQLVDPTASPPVVQSSPASCPLPVAAPANPSGTVNTCLVKVWAQRTAELQVIFFTSNMKLSSDAVARYERRTC